MKLVDNVWECLSALPGDCRGVACYGDCLPLLSCRARTRLPEEPRSVIVCLFPYYVGEYPGRNLSRYAMVTDYHRVAGALLEEGAHRLRTRFPGRSFVPFVDNSPIREVAAARLAGLGVVGWNGQLIHRRYGSYVFIGTLVTDLELEPGSPEQGTCLECGACLAACPTGAIDGGGQFHRDRCRSHITQKKRELSPWEREQVRLGGMVWGCDLCTDACPLNRGAERSPLGEFYRGILPVFHPGEWEALPDRAYFYRGREVLRRNWEILGGGADGGQTR